MGGGDREVGMGEEKQMAGNKSGGGRWIAGIG